MSVFLILALVVVFLVVVAIVVGWIDRRKHHKPPKPEPYVERERVGW